MNIKFKLWFIVYSLWSIFFCGLLIVDDGLLFAQDAKLKVSADVRSKTLILDPQASSPASPQEGQIYYDDAVNQLYYYDGSAWQVISAGGGGQDKTVATKIVAVKRNPPNAVLDSLDATRADYTCDGIDDQIEIQAAIDALGSKPGAIYLLEGTYSISGPIKLNTGLGETPSIVDSGKAIIGAGSGTVLKLVAALNNERIIKNDSAKDILIANLRIDGNDRLGTNVHGLGTYSWSGMFTSKINNLWIENMSGCGIYITSGGFLNNIITQNHFLLNKGCGIRFYLGAPPYAQHNNNIMSNNIACNNDWSGISVWWTGGSYFTNNIISNNITNANNYYGISISTNGTWGYANIVLGNLACFARNGGGMRITSDIFSVISGNIVDSNVNGQGFNLEGGCWYPRDIGGKFIDGTNIISGNYIGSNTYAGMSVIKNNDSIIIGNILYENSASGGERDAIYISPGTAKSMGNIISANRIQQSQAGSRYGISFIFPACENNYVVGNHITGTFTAPIYDNGTNTKYTDKVKLTLEPASGYTISSGKLIPNGPTSYLRLNPTADVDLNADPNIELGKSAGDMLILENSSLFKVTVQDRPNTKLKGSSRDLNQNDVLTLIWNGSAWIETGFVDN